MRIFPISQPWDGAGRRAGDYLIDLFQQVNPSYRQFKGIIAFLKEVGVAAIEPAARDFSARGGTLQFIIGIDLQGTSFQGLQRLLQLTPEVWVFNVPGSSTFHPKYYLFERQHHATVIIGSSNLTQGGLFRNFEVNLGVELNLRNREDRVSYGDLVAIWNQYFQLPTGNLRRLDQGLLTQLLQRGYLFDETVPQPGVTQAGARGGGTTTGTGLFPRLPVPGAPRLPARIRPTAAPVTTPLPTVSFLETVEHVDVSQAGGRSPDIFVPLRSINVNPDFWQWPQAYQLVQTGTGRNYQERRATFLINLSPAAPHTAVYRLYFYQEKSEFRFNCGEVRAAAARGDILCISQAPPGAAYEYEVTLIKHDNPLFAYFSSLCVNAVGGNSTRRWGYV